MSYAVVVPGWTDDAAFQELRQSQAYIVCYLPVYMNDYI